MVISSGSSAMNFTPEGTATEARLIVSLMSICGDVDGDLLGDLRRQRLDGDLAGDVLEHAALADAGRLVGPLELDRNLRLDLLVEADLEEVEVQ